MTPIDDFEEFADHARQWARQTIIFTLQYRPSVQRSQADEKAEIARMSDESAEIVNALWTTAATAKSRCIVQTAREFVRLVLEWSSENLPKRMCGGNGRHGETISESGTRR